MTTSETSASKFNEKQADRQDLPIVVCALYKFATLADFESLKPPLQRKMENLGVRGTLLLAKEGINGTVAGTRTAIDDLLDFLINAYKDLDVGWVEEFVLVEEWLELEKTEFLDAFGSIYTENFFDYYYSFIAALVIILREILISGLRESISSYKISLDVSLLSKWKFVIGKSCLQSIQIVSSLSFNRLRQA